MLTRRLRRFLMDGKRGAAALAQLRAVNRVTYGNLLAEIEAMLARGGDDAP